MLFSFFNVYYIKIYLTRTFLPCGLKTSYQRVANIGIPLHIICFWPVLLHVKLVLVCPLGELAERGYVAVGDIDRYQVKCDTGMWQVTRNAQHKKCEMGCDMWHMPFDTWHLSNGFYPFMFFFGIDATIHKIPELQYLLYAYFVNLLTF